MSKSSKFDISKLLVYIGGIFCVTCWGLSFVATKIVMDGGDTTSPDNIGLTPTEAYIYRFVLAYAIIFIFFSHRKIFCDTFKDEMYALLCGLTSGSIYFIAENTALEFTYVSNVSLLSSTSPLVTVLIVGLLYKSQRPSRAVIVGSLVAFAGVTCVILNSATSIEIRPVGDLLALSTAVSWAFYSLIVKRLTVVYDALFLTRKTFFYGIVTALPFLAFEPTLQNPVDFVLHGWPWVDANLLFLVLFPSIVAFYLWNITVQKLGPVTGNNFLYLQPVVTVIASALILGERITVCGYTGFVLILFGLWLGYYLEQRWAHRGPNRHF